MRPEIVVRSLFERGRLLVWWAAAAILYPVLIGLWWPSVRDSEGLHESVSNYPEVVQAVFGGEDLFSVATAPGFLHVQLFALVVPVALAVFAIGFARHTLPAEEESGLLDLLVTYPTSRRRLLVEKSGAIVASLLALGLLTWLTLLAMDALVDLDITTTALAGAVVGVVLLSVFHASVALAVGAATGDRGLSVAAGAGAVVVGLGLLALSQLAEGASWVRYLSPYYYGTANEPLTGSWPIGGHITLLVLIAVALVGADYAFERRDLRT